MGSQKKKNSLYLGISVVFLQRGKTSLESQRMSWILVDEEQRGQARLKKWSEHGNEA